MCDPVQAECVEPQIIWIADNMQLVSEHYVTLIGDDIVNLGAVVLDFHHQHWPDIRQCRKHTLDHGKFVGLDIELYEAGRQSALAYAFIEPHAHELDTAK